MLLKSPLVPLALLVFFCLLDGADSDLTAVQNLPCGESHHCAEHEFCSEVDYKCRPCNKVCNEDDPNYNLKLCEGQCQSYIHHSLYIPRLEAQNFASKDDVRYLSRMLYAFVALCVVQTLVLVALLLFFGHRKLQSLLWKRKKEQAINSVALDEKPEKLQTVAAQLENTDNNNKRRLHKIGREPSESELPEYAAYDNHAMSVSPSPVHSV